MPTMLQDPLTIRYYQRLTDGMVDLWHRGRRMEEIRLYTEGYIACMRQSNHIEPYLIHRLEDDAYAFLRDPSNFSLPVFEVERDYDYR